MPFPLPAVRAAIVAVLLVPALVTAQALDFTFTDITPEGTAAVEQVGVHPFDGEKLVVVHGNGIRLTSDGGATWTSPTHPPASLIQVERLFVHKGRPGVVFLQEGGQSVSGEAPKGGATYRSGDFGNSWTLIYGPLTASLPLRMVSPFASDPIDPERIYATSRSPFTCFRGCVFITPPLDNQILASTDGGLTWYDAAVGSLPRGSDGTQSAEGPVPAAPSRLFLTSGQAYFSNDSGRVWQALPWERPDNLTWVRQDPYRPSVLFAQAYLPNNAALGDYTNVGKSRLFRSDDAGASWSPILDINDRSQWSGYKPTLTFDHVTWNLWLSGIEAGLLLSTDDGRTWANLGFPAGTGPTITGALDPTTRVRAVVPSTTEPGRVYVVWKGRLYAGYAPALRRDPVAVEFRAKDRYWISANHGETVSQDYRGYEALRTELRFGLWSRADAPQGAMGVCRFQGNPAHGQNSRFITLKGAECGALRGDPGWILEGEDEAFAVPAGPGGQCAAGTVAVTRFVNGLRNANHRYVVDAAVAKTMRASGWIEEGVAFCARPLGSNE